MVQNVEQRNNVIFKFFNDECMPTLRTKGKDYSGPKDAHAEFKEIAEIMGITPQQVLGVFYLKHVFAIIRYFRDDELSSESLASRITDLVNYPLILLTLVDDLEQERGERLDGVVDGIKTLEGKNNTEKCYGIDYMKDLNKCQKCLHSEGCRDKKNNERRNSNG